MVSDEKLGLALHQTEQGDDRDGEKMLESRTQYRSRLCFLFPVLSLCQSSAEKGWRWLRKVEKLKEAKRRVAASLSRIVCGNGRRKGPEFLYDPESYALNFDRGAGHDQDWDFPAFSLKFACPSRIN